MWRISPMTSPCDLLCVNIGTRKPVSIVIMQYIALDPGLHDIVNIVGFWVFFFTVIYVRFPITKKCLHTQLPTKALSWKFWSMWIKMTRRPLGIIIGRGTFSCVTYLYECSLLYNITIFVCESIYWLTTFIIWECVLLHFLDMHSSVFLVYDYKKKNGYLIVLEITYERNENLYCIDNICNDNIRQWTLKEIIKR